jgi:hypothetical protein
MSENQEQPSETIKEFCRIENFSVATFHKLQRLGRGPIVLRVGGLVRVTETHGEWRNRMAALAQEEAAKLEQQRRIEQASRAGKLAVQSLAHPCRRKRRRT